ncbi:MAG: ribosome maturation factor RimP [Oscillospiraceae bacterium]|jgi:ribosome maturation factor RimP|nr:ribosome maturation factor RimP [Oscillospiraceae bacterium]
MPQTDIQTFVMPLCRKMAEEMGFELVDAELVKEGPGRYLRIYLDKPGGFTLDDCERFHRAVQPRLEKVDYDFLEVSSPGADRPLKTEQDFARAMGKPIEVRLYRPLDGQKSFEGALAAFDGETLTLKTEAGARALPRKAIALVKPVLVFDEADLIEVLDEEDDATNEGEKQP